MNVATASKIIKEALDTKLINMEEAIKYQQAIRAKTYFGNPMTGEYRKALVENRFGL